MFHNKCFTLPDTVKENESFFCQVGYDPKVACQWNRKGSVSSDITSQTPPTAEGEGKQNDLMVLSIVIPIIAIMFIIVLVFWILYKRIKHTMRKPPLPELPTEAELQHLEMMARPELLTEERIENAKRKLLPEQVALLEQSTPRLFLTGPRGTGKTMVLFLKGVEWLQKGEDVYIVSTGRGSRGVTILLYNLILRSINPQQTGRLHLLLCDLIEKEEVDKIVRFLSEKAERKKLYIIADEVGLRCAPYFYYFCDELLAKVSDLHFWAASSLISVAPSSFQVEYLTRPIRSPLEIVTEGKKQEEISEKRTIDEQSRLIEPESGNNSSVKHLYHKGKGHSEKYLTDCSTCGQELAKILCSIRNEVLGNEANSTSVPSSRGRTSPLEWRDMLVLHSGTIKDGSGILVGLKDRGIPVRVMKNQEDIEDSATGSSDVVWVADEYSVLGLERAVVVCLGDVDRPHFLSRWCLHLVVVSDRN